MIELLVAAGVLVESTGKKRDRAFAYQAYLDRLRVGTELDGAPRVGGAHRSSGASSTTAETKNGAR